MSKPLGKIYNKITQRGLRAYELTELSRAWPPWLVRCGRFGRAWRPRTACSSPWSAQSRAIRPPGQARQAIFDNFGSIVASMFNVFRGFLRCHRAGDWTDCAHGRTFVFASRRSTLEGSQARQKLAKSWKLEVASLLRHFPSEPREKSSMFSISSATQPRFSSPRHAPGCSRALLFAPQGDLGDPLGSAGTFRGRPKTLSRRPWDGLGTLLGANGIPGWLHLA